MNILYITVKDIKAFFMSEKKVFIWLLICMISGAFVLNYSYSFARWRGDMYEYATGSDIQRYKIIGSSQTVSADVLLKSLSESDFPQVKDYQLFSKDSEERTVVGSSFISRASSAFTGSWFEGYTVPIENTGENVCAVDISILDYKDRLKMTGETFVLDGEEFTIKGVFGTWQVDTKVVIFDDKFKEKYGEIDSMWVTFSERLNEKQLSEFKRIVREIFPQCRLSQPPEPGTAGAPHTKANQLQYSGIVIMLIVCLVSLIKYWQSVNLPAYTIYWINGASNSVIMRAALCESLLLCVSAYLAGLGLNMVFRGLTSYNSRLTAGDYLIGFAVFFGTFTVFTLINTAKICRQFKTANVRRD